LWFLADKLAVLMIGDSRVTHIDTIDYKVLHNIAFSVVGIVLLAITIPEIIKYIVDYLSISGRVIMRFTPDLIAKIVKLALGFWLVLGSKGIVNRL
jgi:hypothetical protein